MPEATGPTQWQLFDRFWQAYPKRYHRMAAWDEWRQIAPRPTEALVATMVQTLAWQKKDAAWNKDGGKWIPWPASWLRDRRWEDEPFEPQSSMPVRQERPLTKSEAISRQNEEAMRKVIERLRQRLS